MLLAVRWFHGKRVSAPGLSQKEAATYEPFHLRIDRKPFNSRHIDVAGTAAATLQCTRSENVRKGRACLYE